VTGEPVFVMVIIIITTTIIKRDDISVMNVKK
jgi:hypothetical protein